MRLFDAHQPLSEGISLIEASAGTGKTYTITTLYLRSIVELDLTVDEILVVTFTEAATAELRDRIRSRLRDALTAFECEESDDELLAALMANSTDVESDARRMNRALADFDEAAIFTIHGFCQRMLREHAFESGVSFDTELLTDEQPLLDQILQDFWVQQLYAASPLFLAYIGPNGWPSKLGALVKKACGNPDMPVLPEVDPKTLASPIGSAVTPETVEQLRDTYDDASAIWADERDAITSVLLEHKGLNRRSYGLKSLPKWFDAMDETLSRGVEATIKPFKMFGKFCTDTLAATIKKNHTPPHHPFFDACQRIWDAKETLVEGFAAEVLALKQRLVAFARKELPKRKKAAQLQSFNDLLHLLDGALSCEGGDALAVAISKRYRAALIDEFQDTDPVQYRIFHTIFADRGRLFLIGDPKQAIYAFRGADIFAYLQASRDAGSRGFTLGVNWRSDPRLIDAVNLLFERANAPFVFDDIGFKPVSAAPEASDQYTVESRPAAPMRLLFLDRETAQTTGKAITKTSGEPMVSDAIARDIARLLNEDISLKYQTVKPADIAILVRTNRQALRVQDDLRRYRVPSVLHCAASVFSSTEAVELGLVLNAIAEPSRPSAVRNALVTPMFSLDATEMAALEVDESRWDGLADDFKRWHHQWTDQGFIVMFRSLLEDQSVSARLLGLVDGERRMTNLLHLAELLHTAASRQQLGIAGLQRWFAEMRATNEAGESAQLRLESDEAAVQIITMHKAKGLQYPIVYCPYLWSAATLFADDAVHVRYHDTTADNLLTLDIGSPNQDAHKRRAQIEERAESMRLLYVALTRAKHACNVVWGNFSGREESPLGYLLHPAPSASTATDERERLELSKSHIKALSEDDLRTELDELARASKGAISVEPLRRDRVPPYASPQDESVELVAQRLARRLDRAWRLSSFSQLIVGSESRGPHAEGLDRDSIVTRTVETSTRGPAVPLAEFPRGTRAGNFFHLVFENLDFHQPEPAVVQRLVSGLLERHGLDSKRWTETVCQAVEQVLETPLDSGPDAAKLADVRLEQRLAEMEFVFPVSHGNGRLSPRRLAQVFRRFGGAELPVELPSRLERLSFFPFEGFLRGFIDLVFEHRGRFFVADYKSNHLGDDASAYEAERLPDVMLAHDYYLQYHLYALAVHRYLTWRLPDYDYDEHFGGVYYLFIKGMSPDNGPNVGVFRDRPKRALIEALSEVVDRPAHPLGGEV